MTPIVLAYSGGLASSIAVPWLAEEHGAAIVTVTMDLGRVSGIEAARERAIALGATRAHVLDLRAEFAQDLVLPSLQADALRGETPFIASLSWPIVAKHLVRIAHIERAAVVAHGGGADVPLDALIHAIDPAITVGAPARTWAFSRHELVEAAIARRLPLSTADRRGIRVDANLWGRVLHRVDTGALVAADAFALTRPPAKTPDAPAYLAIEFDRGVPVSVNRVAMSLLEIIDSVETIAAAHGVGRTDDGRELCESPAAVALHSAHRALQVLVTPPDLVRLAADLVPPYADAIANGGWFSPMRGATDALVAKIQEQVTGTVRLELSKGECRVVDCSSPHSSGFDVAAEYTIAHGSTRGAGL